LAKSKDWTSWAIIVGEDVFWKRAYASVSSNHNKLSPPITKISSFICWSWRANMISQIAHNLSALDNVQSLSTWRVTPANDEESARFWKWSKYFVLLTSVISVIHKAHTFSTTLSNIVLLHTSNNALGKFSVKGKSLVAYQATGMIAFIVLYKCKIWENFYKYKKTVIQKQG